MISVLRVSLAASFIFVGLSGCSHSDNTPKKEDVVYIADDHSCELANTDGAGVQNYTPSIQTILFGKKIDLGHLFAVSKASAQDTAGYIRNNLGTQIYSVDTPVRGKCAFFNFLPAPPADLANRFLSIGDPAKGMVLAGLFLPRLSPGLPSVANSPAILIMKNIDRWVMVHEMTHDLFENEIMKENPTINSRMDIPDLIDTDYNAFLAVKDRSSDLYATRLAKVEEDVNSYVTYFPLEEVTVETLLKRLYDSGYLKYAFYSKNSSLSYIHSSLEKAQQVLEWI